MTDRGQSRKYGIGLLETTMMGTILLVAGAIAVPKLSALPSMHRDQQRKEDLRAVRDALQSYYQIHNSFPGGEYGQLAGALNGTTIPTNSAYFYLAQKCSPDCQGFSLSTTLERFDDPTISVGPNRYVLHE